VKDTESEESNNDDEITEEDEDEYEEYEGFVFLHNDIVCSTQDKAGIPKTWILLDSQSTMDVFSNPRLLTNILTSKTTLTLHCNAGKAIVQQKGDLKGYGTIWYYPEGIANILSLHKVQEKYKVTYDSSTMAGFVVHKSDGTKRVFKPSRKGLFFSDVKHENAHVLVHTVDSIKNKYTVKEYSDAHKARSIQDIIGQPSTKDYIRYVENNMLPNCPITKADIIHAEEILGPNLGSLKGKMTRTKPLKVTINTYNELPKGMLDKHGNVTLAVDIMYINGIPFVMTTSRAIHFGTAELIKNEKISTIMIAIKQVIEAYEARGFQICYILADGQFEHARKHIEQMGIY